MPDLTVIEHEPKSLHKKCALRDCWNWPSVCRCGTALCCRAEANTSGNGCGSIDIFLARSALGHRTHNHDCGYAQSRLSPVRRGESQLDEDFWFGRSLKS